MEALMDKFWMEQGVDYDTKLKIEARLGRIADMIYCNFTRAKMNEITSSFKYSRLIQHQQPWFVGPGSELMHQLIHQIFQLAKSVVVDAYDGKNVRIGSGSTNSNGNNATDSSDSNDAVEWISYTPFVKNGSDLPMGLQEFRRCLYIITDTLQRPQENDLAQLENTITGKIASVSSIHPHLKKYKSVLQKSQKISKASKDDFINSNESPSATLSTSSAVLTDSIHFGDCFSAEWKTIPGIPGIGIFSSEDKIPFEWRDPRPAVLDHLCPLFYLPEPITHLQSGLANWPIHLTRGYWNRLRTLSRNTKHAVDIPVPASTPTSMFASTQYRLFTPISGSFRSPIMGWTN